VKRWWYWLPVTGCAALGVLGILQGIAMIRTGHQPLSFFPPWLAFTFGAFYILGTWGWVMRGRRR
jgi:hypothetical protein